MNLGEVLVAMMAIGVTGGVIATWIDNWRKVKLGPPTDPEELLRHLMVTGAITEDQYEKRVALLRYGPKLELN